MSVQWTVGRWTKGLSVEYSDVLGELGRTTLAKHGEVVSRDREWSSLSMQTL